MKSALRLAIGIRLQGGVRRADMSQRSITAFFTPARAAAADTDPAPPVTPTQKARKRQRIESSDSDEASSAAPTRASTERALAERDENLPDAPAPAHTPATPLKPAESRYEPDKADYCPVRDASWAVGEPVPYLALARTLQCIEATSARLRIVTILSNYLRSVLALTPADLLPSLYLCLNRVAPAHHGLELGVAETHLMKAVAGATGRTLAQVKAETARSGDLGAVAEQARAAQRLMFRPAPLSVRRVLAALRDLAAVTGQASMSKKTSRVQTLLVACRDVEARYLVRCMAGKLRVGLAEQSVLQALAQAATLTPPAQGDALPPPLLNAARGLSAEEVKALVEETALVIKTTYCECPDYERLVPALLQHGAHALPQHVRLTPGVPLKPMLAHPARGVSAVLQRFDGVEFTCEWKYDGERAQIHVPCGTDGERDLAAATVFSRNQENNTSKYPDVLARLPALLAPSVTSCVLDCEAVAWDPLAQRILPFQVLATRKRKDAAAADIKVQVCVFVFDLLYLNGRALVRLPLAERRRLLREHVTPVPGQWQLAEWKDCAALEDMQDFLEEAVRGCCEGLMVKTLSGDRATYEIAKRSRNWLKLKKDYLDGAGDSVDAVVVGAYLGRGKRAGLLGGFLLACYDPTAEQFQSLCKLGTGFSDQDLQRLSAELRAHEIPAPRAYYRYDASHAPDVWLAPAAVWEVRCADLSLSPAHRAAIGLVDPERGISLRFPRFVRARDDKRPEEATSARQVAELYLAQDQVREAGAGGERRDEDEFY